jgi:hypothetical protein
MKGHKNKWEVSKNVRFPQGKITPSILSPINLIIFACTQNGELSHEMVNIFNDSFENCTTLTTKENLRNKFGIIQEFLEKFIFHEKELKRNYLEYLLRFDSFPWKIGNKLGIN